MERNGLSKDEVIYSRKMYGSNRLIEVKKRSLFKIFIESFSDPIIKILLIALVVKVVFLFRDFNWFETLGILIAVLLSTLISSISEYGSEEAFKKLQAEENNKTIKVRRDGKIKEINIDDIVVGDIMIIQSGDLIGADGKIIYGSIEVDESKLNGESIEKNKGLFDKVYRGSVVYNGSCEVKVLKVGNKSMYGSIASELQEIEPESPLKIRLRELAKLISKIGYVGALLVMFSYLFSIVVLDNHFQIDLIIKTLKDVRFMADHLIYALTLAVTIIVVAVPEGLPMMITLVLSSNMKKMLKNNVLVRKLVGIETTGSMNMLFTDKTGTLTNGNMEVVAVYNGVGKSFFNVDEMASYKKFYEYFIKGINLGNESVINNDGKVIGGNYTDRALLCFGYKNVSDIEKIFYMPFDSVKKYSTVTINDDDGMITYVKGACDLLLDKCKYYVDENGDEKIIHRSLIDEMIYRSMVKGGRVIGLFYTKSDINNLVFISLIVLKDELRSETYEAVKQIQNAGIKVVMITGDAKETAYSIAKDAGLMNPDDIVLTSEELNSFSDNQLSSILNKIRVVARALPTDKSRLVRVAMNNNYVVGMTGDGVNDAPALLHANVGFAMGSGTEVAKEASDIVIMDDNIMSISKAVLYGRTIFKSIRKFIIYQLTCNFCALFLSIIGPFMGIHNPITIVQMLWINMIMDTFAGLAFSYEPTLDETMLENPKDKKEPIVNKYMYSQIIITGGYSALLCFIFLKSSFISSLIRPSVNNKYLLTAYFALFIFIGICNAFNARTHRLNILANLKDNIVFLGIFLFILIVQIIIIYEGGSLFRTFGLTPLELALVGFISFTVIPFDLFRKVVLKKLHKELGV